MSTPRRKATAKPKPPNNPYRIDDRAWSRIVGRKKPTIDRIMFAAALDPLLLADLDEIQPPRSFVECVHLADMGTRGDLRSFLKGVLIQWVMSDRPLKNNVRETVRNIASWDRRLGVWCAASCAESVLRFVPAGEDRPSIAVEAAKDWVFGVMDSAAYYAAARDAAYASRDAVDDGPYNADYARFYAAAYAAANAAYAAAADAAAFYAVNAAADDAGADDAAAFAASTPFVVNAADAVSAAATAASSSPSDYSSAYGGDVTSIRNVIAHAIETYPVDQS